MGLCSENKIVSFDLRFISALLRYSVFIRYVYVSFEILLCLDQVRRGLPIRYDDARFSKNDDIGESQTLPSKGLMKPTPPHHDGRPGDVEFSRRY